MEIMVVTAGKNASSVKNATPPDVYKMRSSIMPFSTRQRMSRQPSGGIAFGCASLAASPAFPRSFQRYRDGILSLSLAFGLCFGAPVLSGKVFGAHIVRHSRHPKHGPSVVKDSGKA